MKNKSIEDLLEGKSLDFIDGFIKGVWLFAHWSDGEQYVGTCGTKFKDVVEDAQEMARKVKGEK
jgi:hypothetical protein